MAKGIFQHILNRALAHVVRFSSKPQHFPESVAEHSFYVAYITAILCELLQNSGEEKVEKGKAISMALVHDIEETFSGDILGPFKHYSQDVADAIRKVNQETVREAFSNLPPELSNHFVALWNEEGQAKTIEAQIVKMADKLSLVAKCAEEVEVGNEFFRPIYEQQLTIPKEDHKLWWKRIKEKVLQ